MTSRQLRALIALVAVIGVAIIVGMQILPVGIGILVLGVAAIAVVLKRTADAESSDAAPRGRRAREESSGLDQLEDLTGSGEPLTSRTRPAGAPEPLQTWTPPDPLQTWTPATNRSIEPTTAPSEPETPWSGAPAADVPESPPVAEPTPQPEPSAHAANPLDDLDRLDEVDVVAEVERLDSAGAASTIEPPVESPINEEVESPDDIMAASEATELTIGTSDNTELAKLLAKVQERLSAYE